MIRDFVVCDSLVKISLYHKLYSAIPYSIETRRGHNRYKHDLRARSFLLT